MNIRPTPGHRILSREEQIRPYKDVAEGMEAQFNSYMIERMKGSVAKDSESSTASNYYESLQDYERAKIMSETHDGVGLKKMILEQILPAHLKQSPQGALKAYRSNTDVPDVKGVDE